jgi:hypothetical protein
MRVRTLSRSGCVRGTSLCEINPIARTARESVRHEMGILDTESGQQEFLRIGNAIAIGIA